MKRPIGTTRVPFVPSSATPLDSGLRRNDEWGSGLASARAVVGGHSRGRVKLFSYQSLMPAPAGTPRDENQSRGLVQRIGTADSAMPHTDPSGGQAPALHFPIPTPLDSSPPEADTGHTFAGKTSAGAGISTRNSILPTNRSSRACAGTLRDEDDRPSLEAFCCRWPPSPPLWIPAFAGMTKGGSGLRARERW